MLDVNARPYDRMRVYISSFCRALNHLNGYNLAQLRHNLRSDADARAYPPDMSYELHPARISNFIRATNEYDIKFIHVFIYGTLCFPSFKFLRMDSTIRNATV